MPMSDPATLKQIGQHWKAGSRPIHYNGVPGINRFHNEILCGVQSSSHPDGARLWLAKSFPGRVFRHAISVGSGAAAKEMHLLKAGLVERFTCFELSETRVSMGLAKAAELGLQQRISFRVEDAFAADIEPVDLVHWQASLHHMFDVHAAVRWSRDILEPGGVFFMREFVGPTRMQFSAEALSAANQIRASLPASLFGQQPRLVRNIGLEWFAANDPSECADSANIVPAVRSLFPNADWRWLGGLVFFLACKGLCGELRKQEHAQLLEDLIAMERNHLDDRSFLAAAMAVKG
jgi:SAM-dependent methyltransferase